MVYGLITLLPLIWHDSPYYTPLSKPAWFFYASIIYVTFFTIAKCYDTFDRFSRRSPLRGRQASPIWTTKWHYRAWILDGMELTAEKTAENQSSKLDIRILSWTIGALGDEDSLEKFFQAIPGLFNSKLVNNLETNFPVALLDTFWFALYGFTYRTFSSNAVTELVKSHRADIYKDITSIIPRPFLNFPDHFSDFHDRAPVSIERLQAMTRWCTHASGRVSNTARIRAAMNLARMEERDGRWIALASHVSGLSAYDLQRDVSLAGDNMLLATVIDTCRRDFHSNEFTLWGFIEALTEFDIHDTFPTLQHDFCTLWNELVQEANQMPRRTSIRILSEIRHFYNSLHRGTDASVTAFSASTGRFDGLLWQPSSYPLCNIASHRPDSTTHVPVPNLPPVLLLAQPGISPDALSCGGTVSRQVRQASIAGPSSPSDPTTSSNIGDNSQAAAATEPSIPVCTSSHNTDAPPPGAVTATLQDTSPAAVMSHSPEGSTQQYIVAAGAASTWDPSLSAMSVVGFSSPQPSRIIPFPAATSHALLGRMTPSLPIGNATLPRFRARGLINSGGMCFANAMLQLLLHSPPFWNLFRKLGDLKWQREAGGLETGGSATPLADATVRFFDEFIFKEESPSTQQPPQQSAGGKPSESEEAKEHDAKDSFEPTYLYDAMKEKKHLRNLLVRSCDQDSPSGPFNY
jgi:hypothetical protein